MQVSYYVEHSFGLIEMPNSSQITKLEILQAPKSEQPRL